MLVMSSENPRFFWQNFEEFTINQKPGLRRQMINDCCCHGDMPVVWKTRAPTEGQLRFQSSLSTARSSEGKTLGIRL